MIEYRYAVEKIQQGHYVTDLAKAAAEAAALSRKFSGDIVVLQQWKPKKERRILARFKDGFQTFEPKEVAGKFVS